MEIANLSDAEFKTMVVRMFTELIEYGNNIKEEMKFTLSKTKNDLLGTNNEGKNARIPINDLKHKEEINIQPEHQEEKIIQENEDSIRCLWGISKHTSES